MDARMDAIGAIVLLALWGVNMPFISVVQRGVGDMI